MLAEHMFDDKKNRPQQMWPTKQMANNKTQTHGCGQNNDGQQNCIGRNKCWPTEFWRTTFVNQHKTFWPQN